jgi:LCP family protein required for cell wall assembly
MSLTPHDDAPEEASAHPADPAPDAPERYSGRASVPVSGGAMGRAQVSPAGPPVRATASVRASTSGRAPATAGSGSGAGGSSGGSSGGSGGRPALVGKGKRRPRWGRIALVALIVLALVGGIGAIGGYFYLRSIDSRIDRIDPFSALRGDRPPKPVEGAQNILMLGSDSRDPDAPVNQASTARTDTIVFMHIPADHSKAYLISLPRDLYVFVPPSADGQNGNRMAKLNAAFAWGGLPLMVQTIEGYTGVRIDHVAVIDFGGFKEVVDALGGVDMKIAQTITSIHKPHRTFKKGLNHLNGAEALDYIRQRYQFADGDFTRIKNQQQFLKAVMDKAVSSETLTNPGKLNAFLTSVANALTVDKDLSIVDMALQFRNLRSNNLVFLTSPNLGSAQRDGESVVLGDRDNALGLYDAVAKDTVEQWLATVSPSPKPAG